MLTVHRLGSVLRIQMSSWGSRLAGLDVSAYLVRGVLVDTGFPHAWDDLRRALRELRPRGAIVTHWHEDHAGNVPALAASGLPIALAPATAERLRERPSILPYRRVTWGRTAPLGPLNAFEEASLCMIHTPGHADDHHVVWDAATETLFSGDLWLGVRSRVMHEHEDPYLIVESLRRAAALRPRRMFDAHRGEVADPAAALAAKIDWMTETIESIERRIGAGDPDRAIVREVLGGEELSGYVSLGEYARGNFVKAVRRHVDGSRAGRLAASH